MSKTIQYSEHNHPLTEVNPTGTYTCHGCKLKGGVGKNYRCNECDYDVHEYCATCPQTLTDSWHDTGHELTLGSTARVTEGACHVNVCGDTIQGMFYKCKQCSFDSHPYCAHGPELLGHYPDHEAQPLSQEQAQDPTKYHRKRRKFFKGLGTVAVKIAVGSLTGNFQV